MYVSERNDVAEKFLTEAMERMDLGLLLDIAQAKGAEHAANALADLAFSIADAVVAKAGESK